MTLKPENITIKVEDSHVFADDVTILTMRIPVPNELLLTESLHAELIDIVTTALRIALGHES